MKFLSRQCIFSKLGIVMLNNPQILGFRIRWTLEIWIHYCKFWLMGWFQLEWCLLGTHVQKLKRLQPLGHLPIESLPKELLMHDVRKRNSTCWYAMPDARSNFSKSFAQFLVHWNPSGPKSMRFNAGWGGDLMIFVGIRMVYKRKVPHKSCQSCGMRLPRAFRGVQVATRGNIFSFPVHALNCPKNEFVSFIKSNECQFHTLCHQNRLQEP